MAYPTRRTGASGLGGPPVDLDDLAGGPVGGVGEQTVTDSPASVARVRRRGVRPAAPAQAGAEPERRRYHRCRPSRGSRPGCPRHSPAVPSVGVTLQAGPSPSTPREGGDQPAVGSARPSSTSATAWPPSWPGSPIQSTASTSSSQGIRTGVAELISTTVRRAAAATDRTRSSWRPGRASVVLSIGLRLLLRGQPDHHDRRLGVLGRERGGRDRVVVRGRSGLDHESGQRVAPAHDQPGGQHLVGPGLHHPGHAARHHEPDLRGAGRRRNGEGVAVLAVAERPVTVAADADQQRRTGRRGQPGRQLDLRRPLVRRRAHPDDQLRHLGRRGADLGARGVVADDPHPRVAGLRIDDHRRRGGRRVLPDDHPVDGPDPA